MLLYHQNILFQMKHCATQYFIFIYLHNVDKTNQYKSLQRTVSGVHLSKMGETGLYVKCDVLSRGAHCCRGISSYQSAALPRAAISWAHNLVLDMRVIL